VNTKSANRAMPAVPFARSYWVVPGRLLAGAFPGAAVPDEARRKIKALIDCGIRAAINLMESHEVDHSGRPFVDYAPLFQELAAAWGTQAETLRFPIRDLGVASTESMTLILETIDRFIAAAKPVYVHCWGGIGRTGTVVGCYLMRHGLADAATVLNKIKLLRTHDAKAHVLSPETPAQRDMVTNWGNQLR
jgi:protein tyrosine phosphatase